jgi:uncharacterized coiled-coil protein SlyX
MELEHRIIKLELKVDDHADELKKLQDISADLRKSLAGIEKTLAQIKYLAMGAVAVVVAQSVGIDKAIKLFL